MRLRIARTAEPELDEIFAYWASRAGLETADRLVDAIEDQLALLAERPNIGRKCDDIAPGVRSFPVGNYIVYYCKARGAIEIVHVFHGARDQTQAWRNK